MKFPNNIFQLVEAEVLRNPERLKQHHWHELDGAEAVLPRDVESSQCAHCLFGWLIAMTPGGPSVEFARNSWQDPEELVNETLVASGRLPIPPALAFADEASALKLIRGRAAEERSEMNALLYAEN